MTITPAARFDRLQTLFNATLEKHPSEQDAFARASCDGDTELHAELCELLRHENTLASAGTAARFGSPDTALRDAMPDLIYQGSHLGAFTVCEEIGVGGMGRVFRAERRNADFVQSVAIKLLRRELLNPVLLRHFSTERKLLAGLNHPGICRLIDAGTFKDGTPYVVMDLVAGEELLRHADTHRLSLVDRLKLFRRVLDAVSHAHHQLVVHRDLKSSNILVDASGQPKLLDFGIAKTLDDGELSTVTATSERFLSFGNAAPEQFSGGNITVACDVYALGTILYELLCGAVPFDLHAASAGALEQQILQVPPAPMERRIALDAHDSARLRGLTSAAQLRRAVSGDLERIVQQCLRKAPSERYSSVEQLDEDLARFLDHRPIRAAQGQTWYRARKFVARNRLPVALTAVLSMSVVMAIVAVGARNVVAIRERDRAQQALQIMRKAFLSADPARVAGEDVTVRAVLDAARPALDNSFNTQPELFADLASTIAEVELSLGLSTRSAQLFDRAADAAQRSQLDPQEHFSLLVMRARALYASGAFDQAAASLSDAERIGVPLSPEWSATKAMTLLKTGDVDEAIGLLRGAVDSMRSRTPDDEWANAARLRLADALRVKGENQQALDVLDETLAWQRRSLSADHPRIALTRIQKVVQQRLIGQNDLALLDAQQVHADLVDAYGKRSPFVAKAGMVLGNSLVGANRSEDAVAVYREALAIFRETLGSTHPNTLRTTFNLAETLASLPGGRVEAIALQEKALEGGELRFGMDSNAVVLFRNSYASSLIANGQHGLALDVLTSSGAPAGLTISDKDNRDSYIRLLKTAHEFNSCADQTTTPIAAARREACIRAASLLLDAPDPALAGPAAPATASPARHR